MPNAVRVICPDCGGTSTDAYHPPCGWCMDGGFIDIDRNADGSVPFLHPDGRIVHLFLPPSLPEYGTASRPHRMV